MLGMGVFEILINPLLLGLAILIAVKCKTNKAKIFSTLLVAVVYWTILPAVEYIKIGRFDQLLSLMEIGTYLHKAYIGLVTFSFLCGIIVVYLIGFIVNYKRTQRSDVDSHYQGLSEAVAAEVQRNKCLSS